ncbi:CAP domain-containing protein [Bacillus alkalicellulosilyticus]|uniref:CAP domain-containing protein n=1 Tax=Alkalihalobacterium alkalicellulosilyticum TaxID=1912214 RepID=UPI0009981F52|nr:CAP domain-containing protein [Bacillus alkalicellulosilyticus]
MKRLGCGIFVVALFLLFIMAEFTFDFSSPSEEEIEIEETYDDEPAIEVIKEEPEQEQVMNYESTSFTLDKLLEEKATKLIEELGAPDRKDPSLYGYEWWVYDLGEDGYIQAGVENNKVVTVFAIGPHVPSEPFISGTSREDIEEYVDMEHHVSVEANRSSYRFELETNEFKTHPLVSFNGHWAQLYFDSFTNKLSSVRFLTTDVLLKKRPYSLTYRGTLPEVEEPSLEQWKAIEEGAEQQVLDITNAIRLLHEMDPLQWDAKVAKVAYRHSEDMNVNNYFSHVSPTKGELGDRLDEGEVKYQIAGENIAANYVDSIAAVEGWLNSEGHRKNLLSEEFTHLGVGVHEAYYTQNFMTPWPTLP